MDALHYNNNSPIALEGIFGLVLSDAEQVLAAACLKAGLDVRSHPQYLLWFVVFMTNNVVLR